MDATSTPPLVECVPNFSEGRDADVLHAIAEAVASVPEVYLLHRDSGRGANRTVFTFVGPPEGVVEAAYRAIEAAVARIDMREHMGTHPRMGACDVCPLIPVAGVSMEAVVSLARQLAERVGRFLEVPVFLYERSATVPRRRNLASIRRGSYEGMAEKMQRPEWTPDYGPKQFNSRSGATAIGARPFLVAYNVNLDTLEVDAAQAIAERVRTRGSKVVGPDGTQKHHPGLLPGVKAIGWFIEDFGQAQVSMNLVDIDTTGLHQAYEAVRREAENMGLPVTGSELVGLIPERVLVEAGRYFTGTPAGQPLEAETRTRLMQRAVAHLGLDQHHPFELDRRVLERAYVRALEGGTRHSLPHFPE
jgi:glutamate formiminotransferase/formiminotetrahydrofolate cyclodeaminase